MFHWSCYHLFGYIALEFCRLDTRNSINVIKEKQFISKPYKSVKVLIPENASGNFPVSWLEESILHLQHAASKYEHTRPDIWKWGFDDLQGLQIDQVPKLNRKNTRKFVWFKAPDLWKKKENKVDVSSLGYQGSWQSSVSSWGQIAVSKACNEEIRDPPSIVSQRSQEL